MAANGGMNLAVGIDMSQFQKDLKILDRDLMTKLGQEKILRIKPFIETEEIGKDGIIVKKAVKGYESLYDAIKRLEKARNGLNISLHGDKDPYNVESIKQAEKYLRQFRKEKQALDKEAAANGGVPANPKRYESLVYGISQLSEWSKATKEATKQLGNYGFIDYDKEAGKIKSLRAAYNKELKAIKAEMASLGDVEPRDLKRREELLTRQIALQEKLNATYKRVSPQKQQAVSDLRAERDAIRLKQKQADIQAKINSLEQDRANARGLDRKIDQIRTERVAVGKLVSAYENLANKQRKYGGDPTAAQARAAALRQEHAALKNLEREELNRMKALNQNNSLFNDQGRIIGRLRTLASRYVSIFTIGHLANKIIETTGYFEKQQVALEGIVGSATKAAEIMNQIKSFAPNSPFQTRQLVDYTKKLAAFSIPADKLFDTTKKLADLSAGLGVDMERIILAYGQVKAAAVLRGQELRQFTEAGIPMVEKLSEKLSQLRGEYVSTGEVFEAISKRQVSFQMVADVLADMTAEGGKFYKMQENLMDTIYGQREKLKDLWTLALNDVGTGLGKRINQILKLMQSLIKNARPIMAGLVSGIAINTLGSIINSVKILITQFRTLGVTAKSAWGFVAAGIGIAIGWFKKLYDENQKIYRKFDEIHKSFQKQTDNMIKGLDELINKLKKANAGTKNYTDAVDTLMSNYSQFIDINETVIQQLKEKGQAYTDLTSSIRLYNEALEKQQKLKEAEGTLKESFSTRSINLSLSAFGNLSAGARGVGAGDFYDKWGMTFEDANAKFKEALEKVKNRLIFDETIGGTRLSLNEDFRERQKENNDTFDELFEDAIRSVGLQDMLPEMQDENQRYWLRRNFFEEALYDNDSSNPYYEWLKLYKEGQGIGKTDFAMLSRINKVFKDVVPTLDNTLEGLLDANGKVDIRKYGSAKDQKYIKAVYDYLFGDNSDFTGIAPDALETLKTAMESELNNFTYHSVYNVNNALAEYQKAVGNTDTHLAPFFDNLLKQFRSSTSETSGRAAAVSATIDRVFSGEERVIAERYRPTDKNYNTTRESLEGAYQSVLDKLGRYGIEIDPTMPHKRYKQRPGESHSDLDKAEIEKLKLEERVISKLMEGLQAGVDIKMVDEDGNPLQAQLFDIAKREKNFTGGGGHNREFPDFFNIFKNAYELYKTATQQGGMERGVAEMRTNPTVQSQYGDMFGSPGAVAAFGFRVGDKSIADIIQENLIHGGLEDGIVDFRKAAQATADELKAYGRINEKERGAYVRMGEQIQKWITETFTKDAVKEWMEELEKGIQDLTTNFNERQADINLYRQLIANGTEPMLGMSVPNVTDARDATTPNSTVIRSYIGQMVNEFNSSLRSLANESGIEYTPYQLGDLKSLSGISEALKSLTDPNDMNNKAFTATKEGEIVMKKLTDALKDLDKTVREEMAKVSGRAATGNRLNDAIFNAGVSAKKAVLDNETIQKIAAALNISPDQVAASMRVDAAKGSADDILKAFLESNNYETLFKAFRQPIDFSGIKDQLKDLIADLPELERTEIERRYAVMQGEADVFNASRGDFAPFFAGLDNYRTADSRARDIWSGYATDAKATQLGSTFNEDANAWSLEGITDPEALAYLNELNRSLDEVGKNGIKLSAVFKKQALDAVSKFAQTAQNSLNAMSDVVKNLVSSVQAFVKAFNNAYDVMNDGENPKWMQDTEAFLGDFAENFEALIAPMAAVIALIIAITVAITVCEAVATPLLIVMAAVVAAAAILAAIIAAFQQHDRNLEHSIEDLKEDVEAFDRAITNLQAAAERSVGFEKLRKNIAATGKELEKATAYAEMARLEKEKKNTDDDKVKEYEQSAQESLDEFLNNLRDVRDELANATEDWADQMGSAIRSAFQNGENAARAFRNTVKTMIGDVIENMLQMAILEPLIESALENWTNSDYLRQKYTKEWTEKDENGNTIKRSSFDQDNYLKELLQNIGDPDKAENFYQSMLMIGDTLIDTVNGMPSVLQDFYKHNSELGTLSGGIESVTEDTARRIEALENSQLGEVFAIRTLLEQYLGNSGGFGDSTMASVQAAVVSIASDTSVISRIMQSFENQLNELRTGPSRPIHVTMV